MSSSPPVHRSISPQQAAEQVSRGEIDLVDVRELDEWQAGRAPGAHHIALSELPSRLPALRGPQPVAFVCASGGRSQLATELAGRQGVHALNVDGGLLAWQRAGLELTAKRAA